MTTGGHARDVNRWCVISVDSAVPIAATHSAIRA